MTTLPDNIGVDGPELGSRAGQPTTAPPRPAANVYLHRNKILEIY